MAFFTILLFAPVVESNADEAPAADKIASDHAAQMAGSLELFKGHVRELLTTQCLKCHGGAETHGEFDLATREGLIKGGESGPAVVIGKPDESRLLALVRHADEPFMPAEAEQLSPESADVLSKWITTGAAYDAPLVDVTETFIDKKVDLAEREFWSLRPLSNPAVPAVANEGWCRTPIDHFVLQPLEAAGIGPNGPADRRKLIRRAYLRFDRLAPDARGS